MDETKYDIRVEVKPVYVVEQSIPSDNRYVFAYTVTIRNQGTVAAKLLSRRWIITDAHGREREISGEGVVGEQPYLQPGVDYRYTSGAILETPVGSMRGTYQMLADDGISFDAVIPAFTLATPNTLH